MEFSFWVAELPCVNPAFEVVYMCVLPVCLSHITLCLSLGRVHLCVVNRLRPLTSYCGCSQIRFGHCAESCLRMLETSVPSCLHDLLTLTSRHQQKQVSHIKMESVGTTASRSFLDKLTSEQV